MTTEQEDQIAKLNRFIINVQSLQDISVKQQGEDYHSRNPVLHSPYFNIPFPEHFGNGNITQNMANALKAAIVTVTTDWTKDAKAQIIKIVEHS